MILAARGLRNLDNREEQIKDNAVVKELRRRTRRIHIKAILTATLLTLSCLYF